MSNAPKQVIDLIERFERNIESYRQQNYNESQVRQEFINPFFEALGWDVANTAGYAEAYKDVIHEDAIRIGSAIKAPDYCFRIGGARKFFLEAKKPSVRIKDDASPAYQVRRYAWSAKLPLSILTDFEEFAVYDCRIRPLSSDKPGIARITYFTYREYIPRWEEIASVFSKEAVMRGSFDKFASGKGRRGTLAVDAAFLIEIEAWRDTLARNLALRNPNLTVRELNFAVQKTIDRVIFLRMCEDRGIELYGQLMALLNGGNVYQRLRYIYGLADDRYNSGLFHFKSEKGRPESPDALTPALIIDDKVLKEIIRRLYYPESPYEFSVLSADILGNVYEQFLGKVIRLTAGHRAVIEEKPEVKKAGGVYYTPTYIVEYIVKNTVGKLCERKTPRQIAKLHILDPACGSGSFLIGAYTYLLNYHRDWYVKDGPQKHTKGIYQGKGGQWLLTTQEKRRILLNNIYGVDIDSQAVEVTKLSLLLKVLEGENQDSLKRQLKMWRERALPDLGSNIKCGNSLIGPDYYEGEQTSMFDEEEIRRVNPFDWRAEFPTIFSTPGGKAKSKARGGFDAVIGNPPYGMISAPLQGYFSAYYKHQDYQKDLYLLFLERYEYFLKCGGLLGVIVSNTWLQSVTFRQIRRYLTTHYFWLRILYLPEKVFQAVVDTHVLIFQRAASKASKDGSLAVDIRRGGKIKLEHTLPWRDIPRTGDPIIVVASMEAQKLFRKIQDNSSQLLRVSHIYNGLKPFEKGKGSPPQTVKVMQEKPYVRKGPAPDATWSPLLRGSLIQRYKNLWNHDYWVLYGPWLAAPRDPKIFNAPLKIVVRQTGDSITATLVEQIFFARDNLHILFPKDLGYDLRYVLGIMNSQLIDFTYTMMNPEKGEALAQVKKHHIEQLPIHPINFSNPTDKTRHDKMVALVHQILDLNKHLPTAKTPDEKTRIQRQINATDTQIDQLVYDLYGLTEEEISIVEGTVVDSKTEKWDNQAYEKREPPENQSRRVKRQASGMAEAAQYAQEGSRSAPKDPSGSGRPVDGVRERTGRSGPSQDSPEEKEGNEPIESTRLFETAKGSLSYPQVFERLAVALAGLLKTILQSPPDQIVITPETVCLHHKALAGDLFPDWAGRYRDVNVQVGAHTPPPFYEVPGLMRLFCDDLAERLRHAPSDGSNVDDIADLLAWVDWRFQWIHPFRDFNGRIGRVLLAAVLYKLALPHIETAPIETDARRQYIEALRAADQGDLGQLIDVWIGWINEAM